MRGTSALAVVLFLVGALMIVLGVRGTYRDFWATLTIPLHPQTGTATHTQQTGTTGGNS